MSRKQVSLPDGSVLEIEDQGHAGGDLVLLHHGTPMSSVLFKPMVNEAASRGLRLAMYSRPGYGGSTRQPGRSVADCASDTAVVLDALGAPEASVMGWSGGGPHALACAALLPDRVRSAATIAGAGPYAVDDLDFLAGMGQENIDEFNAAIAGPAELQAWMDANAGPIAKVTGTDIVKALGDLVSDVDKQALTGGFGEFVAASMREGCETAPGAGTTTTWRSSVTGGSTSDRSAYRSRCGRVLRTGWSPWSTAAGLLLTSRVPGRNWSRTMAISPWLSTRSA